MAIKAYNTNIEHDARKHQNTLTKPQGSLGILEDIACWFATRQNKIIPDILTPHIAIFAADHGVTEEGISAFPSVVTTEMIKNFVRGGAAINVLATQNHATLSIVDVGIASDITDILGIVHAKVQWGTANLKLKPAMTKSMCQQAIDVGRNEAKKAIANGANLLIAGDMGIGNTTASACLICLFTNLKAQHIVGTGTGIDNKTHAHKITVVEQALRRVKTSSTNPDQYLTEVGGLEIAAIAGYYLEAAEQGIPIVIDGFITAAAALAAQQQEKDIHRWMLASHKSEELGHIKALEQLKLKPLLDFKLRLGEGSGAALVLPLVQSAIHLHRDMATFESANISDKDAI